MRWSGFQPRFSAIHEITFILDQILTPNTGNTNMDNHGNFSLTPPEPDGSGNTE